MDKGIHVAALPCRAGSPRRLKFFTSPAKRVENGVASKRVMLAMPDLPARALSHASATVLPIGEMQPRPVTTTRRLRELKRFS
jgi:hypothetical protein